jgi:trigger factor
VSAAFARALHLRDGGSSHSGQMPLEEMPAMSTGDNESELSAAVAEAADQPDSSEVEPKRKLELEVDITDAGPCKKHLKITIPRSEIDLQYAESLETLQKEAVVPGFRPGRAPRQLVVKRFRKQVSQQVKSNLLMSSLDQIDKDYKLDPIVQPRLDIEAIEIPESGPMSFEMDIEVRPQFDLPNYRGLKVKRPVAELSDKDVDDQLNRFLEGRGTVVPKLDGNVEIGDHLTADLTFLGPDGKPLDELKEALFRLHSELRFQNGTITGIGPALEGASRGETRELEAKLGSAVENPDLRGATIRVQIKINDLKRVRHPELNEAFFDSVGVDNHEHLRQAVEDMLNRKIKSEQRQALRAQIIDQLLRQTPFDLPADLVSREERSTIQRLVAQLKQGGMTDKEIRASEASIRANAHESTLRSLKELLLLGKIADAESIEVGEADATVEVEAIAARTGESVRRVRARVEKEGGADSLMTQILERKVIDRILEDAVIEDVPTSIEPEEDVDTLDYTLKTPIAAETALNETQQTESPE